MRTNTTIADLAAELEDTQARLARAERLLALADEAIKMASINAGSPGHCRYCSAIHAYLAARREEGS